MLLLISTVLRPGIVEVNMPMLVHSQSFFLVVEVGGRYINKAVILIKLLFSVSAVKIKYIAGKGWT